MKLFKTKDKSLLMSLPHEQELHGVKIVKLPVGKYLSALDTLEKLPEIIVKTVLPESGGAGEVIAKLLSGDKEYIETLLIRLLTAVPKELCRLLSELLNIPEERLLSSHCDDPLSLKELLDIIEAFWKKNDLTDFFVNVRQLKHKLTAQMKPTASTGFSDGSPSDKASEYPKKSS